MAAPKTEAILGTSFKKQKPFSVFSPLLIYKQKNKKVHSEVQRHADLHSKHADALELCICKLCGTQLEDNPLHLVPEHTHDIPYDQKLNVQPFELLLNFNKR